MILALEIIGGWTAVSILAGFFLAPWLARRLAGQ